MSDLPGNDADLAAIHAEFAEEVTYTGAGLSGEVVTAIASDVPADVFQGPGSTLRRSSFEIRFEALPGTPGKTDVLVDADANSWRPIDITRRRDIGAWLLIVELMP